MIYYPPLAYRRVLANNSGEGKKFMLTFVWRCNPACMLLAKGTQEDFMTTYASKFLFLHINQKFT